MKFELDRLTEYTDEAILSEIRRVAGLSGNKRLTVSQFSMLSKVGASTLRRRFGSWPKALDAAGLGHLYNQVAPTSKSRTLAKSLTDQQIIEEIRRVAETSNSGIVTADDLRQSAVIGVDAIRRRFGTLRAALAAAGVLQSSKARRYSDEDCLENLLSVWTHYGRPPKYEEMNLPPSAVGGKAYVVRWKTWNRALHAFVQHTNQDSLEQQVPSSVAPQQEPAIRTRMAVPEEDQHKIRLGLRYKVLARDNFRCVICGASPATIVGCILHVDHIVPFSKGGKTAFLNLRTLCLNCNLGKGATHQTAGAG